MTDEVPTSFRERIRSLESELDRSVCGYPTDDGAPCRQWPVDEDGRCSRHRGKTLEEGFQSLRRGSGSSSDENDEITKSAHEDMTVRDPRGWKHTLVELGRSPTYWILLIVLGLVTGGAYGMYPAGAGFEPSNTVTKTESIDVEDPDFNKIREWFRSGRQDRVRQALTRIYENASSSPPRAQALYYRYVLEQRVGNHEKALSSARRFLREFDDHSLRSEVLFGAWFLSRRLLNRPEQAQQYEEQLRSEYPESKWVQKIDS